MTNLDADGTVTDHDYKITIRYSNGSIEVFYHRNQTGTPPKPPDAGWWKILLSDAKGQPQVTNKINTAHVARVEVRTA